MIVFALPAESLQERSCFSVLSRCQREELLLLPPGALVDAAANESCWLHFLTPTQPITRLPLTPRTLIPEALAARFPENPVLLSAALCGGTLRARLETALAQLADRLWLLCAPIRVRLPLPCPDAQELPLSAEALRQALDGGTPFYSDAFCCNVLPRPAEHDILLYDTPQSIVCKLHLAEQLGVQHALIYPESA